MDNNPLDYEKYLPDTDAPAYPPELDTTLWHYDLPTCLLTGKTYADGLGPTYTYTPDGKLSTRTWARGVTTTYAYTNGSSLASICHRAPQNQPPAGTPKPATCGHPKTSHLV